MVLKHPREAFVSDLSIARQWRDLGYLGRPELHRAVDEFDALVELLEGFGIEALFLPRDDDVGLDSLYVRDAAVATDDGLILCNMGKDERRTEPGALERAVGEWGLPIRGAITGDGILEGGDVVWIDDRTLAVGRGYRTNEEGIRQLGEILGDSIDELATSWSSFHYPTTAARTTSFT
jgi:N-dimethylarginine dimethylaminohydrolase